MRKTDEKIGKGMAAMISMRSLCNDKGDALVEAAILFPIMTMIFSGLVLLAMFLPAHAALQRATQYAPTAIATESSDTWLFYNKNSMNYYRADTKRQLKNVYVTMFTGTRDAVKKGEDIVIKTEKSGISPKAGVLDVKCRLANYVVYQEIIVTATREYRIPVNLSFINFPDTIRITVTSTAVVHNGDEFVRNMDIAAEFLTYCVEKLGLTGATDKISEYWDKGAKAIGVR